MTPLPSDPRYPASAATSCSKCRARNVCLPSGQDALSQPGRLVGRRIRIRRNQALFQYGDAVGSCIYAVHYGSVKNVRIDSGGHEKITGFQMSGDYLGLDAIGLRQRPGMAIALEDSEVCELSFDAMLAAPVQFYRLLSKEISRAQDLTRLLRHTDAEGKMARFLLDLSWRHLVRGYSARRFRLPMTRRDIANFLGLSPECVSRQLFRFKRSGWLDIDERAVTLLDPQALHQLARETAAKQKN